jgi:hypothetical protein
MQVCQCVQGYYPVFLQALCFGSNTSWIRPLLIEQQTACMFHTLCFIENSQKKKSLINNDLKWKFIANHVSFWEGRNN